MEFVKRNSLIIAKTLDVLAICSCGASCERILEVELRGCGEWITRVVLRRAAGGTEIGAAIERAVRTIDKGTKLRKPNAEVLKLQQLSNN